MNSFAQAGFVVFFTSPLKNANSTVSHTYMHKIINKLYEIWIKNRILLKSIMIECAYFKKVF